MTYVISDIHGNLRNFESILSQINLKEDDLLYVLGDCIDRYPDGIKIIRRIMREKNMKMLLGNHEYMMLQSLDTPYSPDSCADVNRHNAYISRWYRNRGDLTHNYLKHIKKSVRRDVFAFLRSLPLEYDITVNERKYKLVHACDPVLYDEIYLRQPGKYENKTEFCVWYRNEQLQEPKEDYIVIFGHTTSYHYNPVDPMEIWISPSGKLICIDCGSGWPEEGSRTPFGIIHGRLACLRLDDMKVFYSE